MEIHRIQYASNKNNNQYLLCFLLQVNALVSQWSTGPTNPNPNQIRSDPPEYKPNPNWPKSNLFARREFKLARSLAGIREAHGGGYCSPSTPSQSFEGAAPPQTPPGCFRSRRPSARSGRADDPRGGLSARPVCADGPRGRTVRAHRPRGASARTLRVDRPHMKKSFSTNLQDSM